MNKRDLLEVIDKSTEELHQQIDMYRYLMAAILEQRVNGDKLKGVLLPTRSLNAVKLREAVKETIEVLEQSRKAFRSKRLEALRKKLTEVLIE